MANVSHYGLGEDKAFRFPKSFRQVRMTWDQWDRRQAEHRRRQARDFKPDAYVLRLQRLGGDTELTPREFDKTACAQCGGKLWITVPKNGRTGSLRVVPCGSPRHKEQRQ